MKFFWIITLLCSIAAVCIVGAALSSGSLSAVQETSAFALALCVAAIPYIFTRALESLVDTPRKVEVIGEAISEKKPESASIPAAPHPQKKQGKMAVPNIAIIIVLVGLVILGIIALSSGPAASNSSASSLSATPTPEAIGYASITSIDKCLGSKEYGVRVADSANFLKHPDYTANPDDYHDPLPHGARVEVMDLSTYRTEFFRIRHVNRDGYVSGLALDTLAETPHELRQFIIETRSRLCQI